MASSFTIKTVFQAVDSMTKPIRTMTKSVDDLGKSSSKAKNIWAGVGKGFSLVGKGLFGVATYAVAAGTAVTAMAKRASDAAASVMDTAASVGIATDTLQEYRYIAKLSGMETSDMDAALQKMTINLGKGGSGLEDTLAQVGLTVDQLKAAGPDQVLETLAKAFQNVSDPTTKAAVVTALFGKSSIRMVSALSGGAAGIKSLRQEAEDAGYVMDELALKSGATLDDNLDRLKLSFDGLTQSIGMEFVPLISDAASGMTNFIKSNRGQFRSLAKGLAASMKSIAPFLSKIGGGLTEAIVALLPVVQNIFDAIVPIFGPILDAAIPLVKQLAEGLNKIFSNPSFLRFSNTIGKIVSGIANLIGSSLGGLFTGLSGPLSELGGPLSGIVESIGSMLEMLGITPEKLSVVGSAFSILGSILGGAVYAIFAGIDGILFQIMMNIKKIGPAMAYMKALMSGNKEGAKLATQDMIAVVQEETQGRQERWNTFKRVMASTGQDISGAATDMTSMFPISSTSETSSIVDVNFNNAPAGTTVKSSGTAAPNIRLNTGRALAGAQ